jgi:hypothetical protein
VKHNDLLAVTSILSVVLLALHISQDIVFGLGDCVRRPRTGWR